MLLRSRWTHSVFVGHASRGLFSSILSTAVNFRLSCRCNWSFVSVAVKLCETCRSCWSRLSFVGQTDRDYSLSVVLISVMFLPAVFVSRLNFVGRASCS